MDTSNTIKPDNLNDKQHRRVVLQVKNLTKKFDEIVAINNVDFEVRQGEILGIIGANGSGKTTLFNMLSGVHTPTSGKIFAVRNKLTLPQKIKHSIFAPFKIIYFQVAIFIYKLVSLVIPRLTLPQKRATTEIEGQFAMDVGGLKPDKIINEFGIARTFQIVRPFKFLSAQDNATLPHVPRNLFASPSKLKSDGMRSLLAVDLGEKKNYPALILPHGDLKRLDIARTLACDPKIILLDEPFSGLSSEDSFRVTQLIKRANEEFGTTIMIVEHKLKLLANLVERILVLDQGSLIVSGTPKEISQDKRVIDAYLGTEASHIA